MFNQNNFLMSDWLVLRNDINATGICWNTTSTAQIARLIHEYYDYFEKER